MFVLEPYLPKSECSLYVIDKRAEKYSNKLKEVVLTKANNNILFGIDTHPDMNLCHLGGKDIVACNDNYDYYNSVLSKYGFNVIKGKNKISYEYPYDIAYNCVILNKCLYHKLSYTDKAILEYATKNNYKLINVNQGYTKCSTLIVDENSVITSDEGLYKIYKKNNLDVLLVSNKDILLEGFDNGFIGGCGGLISADKLAFFGKLENFSDYNNIKEFLKMRKIEIISLSEDKLTDFGSIIPLIHRQ